MKAVIQTVLDARVTVDGEVVGAIDKGMLVYFCVERGDTEDILPKFCSKLSKLRIFKDEAGKMNLDVKTSGGDILLVSQFTIAGDTHHGNRPGFDGAAPPAFAEECFLKARDFLSSLGHRVETGVFGAHMLVSYTNDGPETFILDSAKLSV